MAAAFSPAAEAVDTATCPLPVSSHPSKLSLDFFRTDRFACSLTSLSTKEHKKQEMILDKRRGKNPVVSLYLSGRKPKAERIFCVFVSLLFFFFGIQ